MKQRRPGRANERGAVLVHVAVGLIGLIGFSVLSVDYGVLWVSRRQAQNAADAGALSGAISLAFVDPADQVLARNSALAVAQQNNIWDAAPDVLASDITFPPCPASAPGLPNTCVKVDVFRNQRAGGNPLPMFFGQILGLQNQGVQATATAQVLAGDSADCVKPWAIADKWLELNPAPGPWEPTSEFNRYVQNGPNSGDLLVPADLYIPSSPGSPGTGFSLPGDYGTPVILKAGNGNNISPSFYNPVVINPAEGPGANNYRNNIQDCDPTVIGPGTVLTVEPGNMVGPTKQGVNHLISEDPGGYWDPTANGGLGAPAGGCMAAGTCSRSPRLVPVPVFDTDVFASGKTTGRIDIVVANVLGFWLEPMQGNDVVGYFTYYPALASGTTTIDDTSAFLRTVILVR